MVPGERQIEREELEQQIINEVAPKGAVEMFWVRQIVDSAWHVRRLMAAREYLYSKHVSEQLAEQISAVTSINENAKPTSQMKMKASGFVLGLSEHVGEVEAIFRGPVDLGQFLPRAYLEAHAQALLIDRAIEIITDRHDRALANIYKMRTLATRGATRNIDRHLK